MYGSPHPSNFSITVTVIIIELESYLYFQFPHISQYALPYKISPLASTENRIPTPLCLRTDLSAWNDAKLSTTKQMLAEREQCMIFSDGESEWSWPWRPFWAFVWRVYFTTVLKVSGLRVRIKRELNIA